MSFFSVFSGKFSQDKWIIPAAAFFLLIFPALTLNAEEASPFYIDRHIRFWGMDFDFCQVLDTGLIQDKETIIRYSAGSSIRQLGYYRDENDSYSADSNLDYDYTRLNTNWGVSIEQGLLWYTGGEKNLLSLHLKYRGIREWNFNLPGQDSLLFDSVRSDSDGILYNTFIISLLLDNVLLNRESGLKKGFSAELSAEAGPAWFLNDITGNSDFRKYFAGVKSFIPFYEGEDSSGFMKAVYLAGAAGIDYAKGGDIPLPARQTFGIMSPESGAGGMVRGFESRRFDSMTKVINNIELRFVMQQIKNTSGRKLLRPGFLVFHDYCFFDRLDGYESSGGESGSGEISSAGFGIFSEVLFTGNFVMYAGFPITGERIDRDAMSLFLTYGLHF